MGAFADLVTKVKSNQTLDMSGQRVDGEIVSAPKGVTGVKLICPSTNTGIVIYESVDWDISGLNRDGLKPDGTFTAEDTSLGLIGGDGTHIHDCTIKNTQGYAQLSIADNQHGTDATNWVVENVTFGAHNQQGVFPTNSQFGLEVDAQEHSVYIHNLTGDMKGTLRNLTFNGPNWGGGTVKLGGIDQFNGQAKTIQVDGMTFNGIHQLEFQLVSAEVTMTNVVSHRVCGPNDVSMDISGSSHITMNCGPLPGKTHIRPLATWLEALLRITPKAQTFDSGKTAIVRGNGVTWNA